MIKAENNIFHINTKSTSYLFRVTKHGDLEHLFYGEKIEFQSDYAAFFPQRSMLLVGALYPEGDCAYGVDDMCFEYSAFGRGDSRESAYLIKVQNEICSFKYHSYQLTDHPAVGNENATSYDADGCLCVVMKEESKEIYLHLFYSFFYESNVITRFARIVNHENVVEIEKLMSAQVDFDSDDFKLLTFDGAWARERYKQERRLYPGKYVNDSLTGASGALHNPFVILAHKNADNFHQDCYGFNLVYSGSHCEIAEVSAYEKTRFVAGIQPQMFRHTLAQTESFCTPECVMTFSPNGYNGVSQNMHHFVQNHIVRGYWKKREKPILLNSWEAMYFDITDEKIRRLADQAAQIGVELLVVDDGWFGARTDDTSSLGDWFVSKDKFPGGLAATSAYIHAKGLQFGLWFEPEMISKNSTLYRRHPDWALADDSRAPVVGRNQYILDLSRGDVQDYIISSVSKVIEEVEIDYIKWDFNRLFSDLNSAKTAVGEMMHAYVMGLYRVLTVLTARFPKILFELCAGGGARFDLGMLCFMPVGWVSDNTDVSSRVSIQEGTSYGYPVTTMCNHISVCPNHISKRNTRLADRCAAASFGVLGLQYDLTTRPEGERNKLREHLVKYKAMRSIIENSNFYRLLDGFEENYSAWLLVSGDQKSAYVFFFQTRFNPVSPLPRLRLTGLRADGIYRIKECGLDVRGDVLMQSGLLLAQNFQGNERSEWGNSLMDFSSILYELRQIKDCGSSGQQ